MTENIAEHGDWTNSLRSIYQEAKKFWAAKVRTGKSPHFVDGEIAAKYFNLLANYYSETDPEKSSKMKLYSDYALVLKDVRSNTKEWVRLMHEVNQHKEPIGESFGIMRQNFDEATRWGKESITGCTIPLNK